MIDPEKELQTKLPLRFHEDGAFKVVMMSDLPMDPAAKKMSAPSGRSI